jgi:hypothetical protein
MDIDVWGMAGPVTVTADQFSATGLSFGLDLSTQGSDFDLSLTNAVLDNNGRGIFAYGLFDPTKNKGLVRMVGGSINNNHMSGAPYQGAGYAPSAAAVYRYQPKTNEPFAECSHFGNAV